MSQIGSFHLALQWSISLGPNNGIPFHFHQTGARLRRGSKVYDIPRELQHEQARKAHLDFDGQCLSD